MLENLNSGIDTAALPLTSPKGATQKSVPSMLYVPSSSASLVCETTSVQQESRLGVLKNRPLPSTVAVTLLGISTDVSPGFRPGRAMMMASGSPETSPTNRNLTPSPFGRCMLSQTMSSADQLISVSMLPYKDDVAAPLSPQVRCVGSDGGSGTGSGVLPQAPKDPTSINPSKGIFCAETDFLRA